MRTLVLAVAAFAVLLSHGLPARGQPCPPAPTNLTGDVVACQGRLYWDMGTNPLEFEVLRGLGPGVNSATLVTTVPGSQREATVPMGGDPTFYSYFVRARIAPTAECPTGRGPAAVTTLIPPVPPTPAWVSINSTCAGATIDWEHAGIATYYVLVLYIDPEDPILQVEVTHPPYNWMYTGGPVPLLVDVYAYGQECGLNTLPASTMFSADLPPLSPLDVQATDTLTCQVNVLFTPHPWHTGGHRVYRDNVLIATLNEGAFGFADLAAVAGQPYTYRVTGFNSCGESTEQRQDVGVALSEFANISPLPQRVLGGQAATLSVPDAPTGAGVTYAWRRGVTATGAGGTPVTNGDRFSGADTPALMISTARPSDSDFYALDVFSAELMCGVATTVVPLVVPTTCAADFDGSGTLGVPDIFAFLAAWFAGCP